MDDARQAVRRLNGEKLLGVRIRVQMTKTIRKRKQKRNNNERKRGERSPPGDERDNTNIDDDYEESYVEHYENIEYVHICRKKLFFNKLLINKSRA